MKPMAIALVRGFDEKDQERRNYRSPSDITSFLER